MEQDPGLSSHDLSEKRISKQKLSCTSTSRKHRDHVQNKVQKTQTPTCVYSSSHEIRWLLQASLMTANRQFGKDRHLGRPVSLLIHYVLPHHGERIVGTELWFSLILGTHGFRHLNGTAAETSISLRSIHSFLRTGRFSGSDLA